MVSKHDTAAVHAYKQLKASSRRFARESGLTRVRIVHDTRGHGCIWVSVIYLDIPVPEKNTENNAFTFCHAKYKQTNKKKQKKKTFDYSCVKASVQILSIYRWLR